MIGMKRLLWCACLVLTCNNLLARPLIFGYATWWVPEARIIQALDHVDRLKFMELRIGADGGIADSHGWPERWEGLRRAASVRGIPIDVALTLFSSADFNSLFGSGDRIKRLHDAVLKIANDDSVSGIHLDVEMFRPLQPEAVKNYRTFVADLTRQLAQMPRRRLVSVFLNHGAETYLYDVASLADVGHIVVQGYDVHSLQSEVAGPLAPLFGPDMATWEKMLAAALGLNVHPPRVLMGFPTYGHEWQVKPCSPRGTPIAPGEATLVGRVMLPQAPNFRNSVVDRVLAHGATHDLQSGSSYYRVDASDGSCTIGWFEDWWTLQKKIDWIVREKVAGLAIFALGYDDDDLVAFAARRFRSMNGARSQ